MSIQCPDCHTDHAYIGLNRVECCNPLCKHYTKKQDAAAQKERCTQQDIDDIEEELDWDDITIPPTQCDLTGFPLMV